MRKKLICVIVMCVVAITSCCSVSFAGTKEHYYGKTPNGKKVYYKEYTVKKYQIKKYAAKPSKKQWYSYAKGLVDVGMVFAKQKYAIPYSVLCAILGVKITDDNVSIAYGTRFFSQAQMHSIKERRFYIYNDKKKTSKRFVYNDQYGSADLNYYVDPVGKGLKIKCLKSKKNVRLKTEHFDNKKYILQRCGINWNHRSKEVWSLDTEILHIKFK